MRNDRRVIAAICYIVLGAVLLVLGMMEMVDEFWSGMGGALIAVGVVRMVQFFRYRNNEEYREKAEIAAKDERNHYIRNKAWAWSGYLFMLIAAVATIAFRVAGQDTLSFAASMAICLLLVLYWVSFLVLSRKY